MITPQRTSRLSVDVEEDEGDDDGNEEIYEMNINGSGIIRVLPDGSGFVIITQSPRDQDPIIVLQWFEELKAKVGN